MMMNSRLDQVNGIWCYLQAHVWSVWSEDPGAQVKSHLPAPSFWQSDSIVQFSWHTEHNRHINSAISWIHFHARAVAI